MADPLVAIGRHGRWMLVAGLVVGIALPELASAMRAAIMPLIGAILFVSVLRVDPAALAAAVRQSWRDLPLLLLLQFALPLGLAGVLTLLRVPEPLFGVLVLTAAAAPIAGGSGLAALTGLDATTALRLLTLGTLLLPLTSILPLQIVFSGSDVSVLGPALRLAAVIVVAGGAAILVRRRWRPGERATGRLDGAGALLLAALVVGLMDAIQPLLLSAPATLLVWLALAFAMNFGMQIGTDAALAATGWTESHSRGAAALMAGNRNLGLFLAALPASSMDAMMVFVGCYQIPMFLSPLLMRRYYARR